MTLPHTTADEIRVAIHRAAEALSQGHQDGAAVRAYIPALVLLKWCSDNFRSVGAPEAPAIARLYPGWRLPEESEWRSLTDDGAEPETSLSQAFLALETANPALEGIFAALGLDRPRVSAASPSWQPGLRDAIYVLSDLRLNITALDPPDAAGRALYDYIQRVAGEWKSGVGWIATPASIVRLLVELTDPKEHVTIYDPACGSGGFLIEAARHVAARAGCRMGLDPIPAALQGEEMQTAAWALAKVLAILHGLPHAEIERANALTGPAFATESGLPAYECVVSSPPFLKDWGADSVRRDRYGRFWRVPPRNVADYAYVQHVLSTLGEGGVAALLLLPGALFRTGVEEQLRERLLDLDVLDAVIALPNNLLFGTGLPPIVMVLRRGRKRKRGRVLVIDASSEMSARRPRNVLTTENISRIVRTCRRFEDDPHFARVVTHEELAANGFDLRPARYVAPPDLLDDPPIAAMMETLRSAEVERDDAAEEIDRLLSELEAAT